MDGYFINLQCKYEVFNGKTLKPRGLPAAAESDPAADRVGKKPAASVAVNRSGKGVPQGREPHRTKEDPLFLSPLSTLSLSLNYGNRSRTVGLVSQEDRKKKGGGRPTDAQQARQRRQ
ncbi:hypothetical protein M9H77_19837 [Catharanthus roseus]|uniref:Uncharacterized protein n=1 Tax=Catharanthus roseus TaxID=4058 RepID=A0ACC0BBJ7_CATRO|nr:hypothetical protein M9H77_19837 [Catharanthus roseus]